MGITPVPKSRAHSHSARTYSDVMAAGPQKLRTKAATGESIDDVREQRHSFPRGHGRGYQAKKRDGRNDDQNLASYGRYGIGKEH